MEESDTVKTDFKSCLLCNKYFDRKPDINSSSPEVTGFESAFKLFCEFISGSSNDVLKYLKSEIKDSTFCSECHFNLLEFERCERIIKETKLAQENILKTLKDALLHPKPLFSFTLQNCDPGWTSLRETLIEEIKKTDDDLNDEEGMDRDDYVDELNDGHQEEKDPLGFKDDFPPPLALVSLEYNSSFETDSQDNGSSLVSPRRPTKRQVCSIPNKGKGRMRSTTVEKIDQSVGHIDAHTCSFCGKRFANTGTLSNHRKRHGPPSLPCPVCNKAFHFPNELRRHMKAAHPE